MINPSFENLSKISNSRYEVCVMVMQRARKLKKGSKQLIHSNGAKAVTVALDEIMNEKVFVDGRKKVVEEELDTTELNSSEESLSIE